MLFFILGNQNYGHNHDFCRCQQPTNPNRFGCCQTCGRSILHIRCATCGGIVATRRDVYFAESQTGAVYCFDCGQPAYRQQCKENSDLALRKQKDKGIRDNNRRWRLGRQLAWSTRGATSDEIALIEHNIYHCYGPTSNVWRGYWAMRTSMYRHHYDPKLVRVSEL